jgi:hypothetical protein
METVDFIIPDIWQLLDLWSNLQLKFVIFPIVAFILGFLIRRFLNKRFINEMNDETEDLRNRLRSAKRLLSREYQPLAKHGEVYGEQESRVEEASPGDDSSVKDTMETALDRGDTTSIHPDSTDQPPPGQKRTVRLVKVFGKESKTKLPSTIVGIEEVPPEVGRSYRVIQGDGSAFCTSTVTKVGIGYIRTENSVYEIEVVNQTMTDRR